MVGQGLWSMQGILGVLYVAEVTEVSSGVWV